MTVRERYNLTQARLFDISFSAALQYVDHLIEADGEYPRLRGALLQDYVDYASELKMPDDFDAVERGFGEGAQRKLKLRTRTEAKRMLTAMLHRGEHTDAIEAFIRLHQPPE